MRTPLQWLPLIRGLFVRALVVGALVLGALIVPLFAGPQRAFAAGSVSDNFNRADGNLGANWTDMTDGGLAISSQVVVGTNGAYSGDIRTGETFASDQSSQIEVTSTQLSGGQWIGAGVRAQNGGQSLYLGLYFWNNGNPELMLFKRIGGNWSQLGAVLVPRCAGGGHPVEPLRLRLDALVLPKRCRAHHGHRHQLDRGCAGRDGLRHPTR